ncbi:MAG: response regulator [Acidobacteria bacterium]|nr:response regulator [Acidobacteriota bacterium]
MIEATINQSSKNPSVSGSLVKEPLRILLVEDDRLDAELIIETLISEGLASKMKRVETRAEYLAALSEVHFNLIISDYSLPSFDGMTALSIAQETCPDIPFILISGRFGEEFAVEALKSGATEYVLKQKLERLAPAVRRALEEAENRLARKKAEAALQKAYEELEKRVQERTAELRSANESLEAEIAERIAREKKITEQAALLDIARDAILVQGLDDRIIYWNKSAVRIYGWPAVEAAGRNVVELIYGDDQSQFKRAKEGLFVKGEWSGELRHLTRDGSKRIVYSRWTLVVDESGYPQSVFVINTDMTERKRLEAQYLRAQRLESIGTLASGIAHDLNNVLSPILMAVHLLQSKFTDEDSQRLLSVLQANTERGAEMVKQVLSFARGAQGERIALQLKHLIREMVKTLRSTFPKSIEIKVSLAEGLWPVFGDATQLHQVLMNLCVNARDAMPGGGKLLIEARNIDVDETYARMNVEGKAGSYVMITVSDTGTGIAPEIINKIFEPFFTTKETGKGTGLGLSTVIGIVKNHGGFVNVYSEVGKETHFKVYLPVQDTEQFRQGEEKRKEIPCGQGELILVVDDEAAIREITRQTLENHGYSVITANDGTEAVALYAEHKDEIKVVMTDTMMPYMDGPATIRTLQRLNPQVKVIAISGLDANRSLVESAGTGVNTFLLKPYSAEKLLLTLAEILNN